PVADPVRAKPTNDPADIALHRPPVLVDEPVMERADEQQIIEVRAAAVAPPHDMVSLGEPARAAAGEPALAVAIPDLTDHPDRGLAGSSAQSDNVPPPSSSTVCTRALHSRRLADSGWITGPSSTSLPAASLPTAAVATPSSCAWTTTVARFGSGSAAMGVEHSARSASARRA